MVYNSSNNELVRTNTLVRSAVVQIDAAPFRQWYESHYAAPVTRKGKQSAELSDIQSKTRSKHAQRELETKQKSAKIDPAMEQQFASGRLYAILTSRPGQSGRADGEWNFPPSADLC